MKSQTSQIQTYMSLPAPITQYLSHMFKLILTVVIEVS